MALSAVVSGAVLSGTGFRQSSGGAILDQAPGALRGITALLAWVPVVFIAAGLGVLVFYPINAARHAEIRRNLNQD